MIRVGLFSQDRALPSSLSSALGKEFELHFEPSDTGIKRYISEQDWPVVLVDLSSRDAALRARVECARQLISAMNTVVVLAEDALRATANDLVRQGAYGYCRRQESIPELRIMLRRAHEDAGVKRESDAAQRKATAAGGRDRIVGSSEAMERVQYLVNCVANIDASVLINGERGTGKELVGRAIHQRGSRARRPFIAVACGAIPETLIDAELFGLENGTLTGVSGPREGFFEQAADGTLFLDEIGELSPYVQAKLLSVLQQRQFCRLGSNKVIPLRARLLFATHRDLREMVAQGKFRQDLYYWINVMKIDIPALQEHPEDIQEIATHFLNHYSKLFHKPVAGIGLEAMTLLQSYPWPGNVRELENVIQRAIIVASGTTLHADDLPHNLREEAIADAEDCIPGGSFERLIREYKIRLAENAVREHNGNKTLAARSLSISRAYLHRLIRLADPEAPGNAEPLPNVKTADTTLITEDLRREGIVGGRLGEANRTNLA